MWTAFRLLAARIAATFNRREMDADFDAEMVSHRALLEDELQASGLTPEDARRQARLTLGPETQLREAHRDRRGLPWLDTLSQDVRYALRLMRRDLGFAVFAILIVGIGVGASATIYSVVSALVLRPLPFGEPARLTWIVNGGADEPSLSGQTVPVGHYQALRDQSRTFADIGAYMAFYGAGDHTLTGSGEPERITTVPVSPNFFAVLGVPLRLGRSFTVEESRWKGPPAIVLSDRLWRRRFNANPAIVGQKVVIDGDPVPVVGVLPASFDFGTIFAPGTTVDAFTAFPLSPETDKWGNTLAMIGRLRPDASLEQARAEIGVLAPQIKKRDPDRQFLIYLTPLADHVSGRLRPALAVLASAVAAVMLIVCANLSNLFLARTTSRQREMAIRVALGAGRRRLVRQMLTESLLLAGAGSLLGLALAMAGTRLVSRVTAFNLPLLDRVQLDAPALVVVLVTAFITGVIFGLAPAVQVPDVGVGGALTGSSRGTTSTGHVWLRATLVVSEVAFACVLLVGAGLLSRSLLRVLDTNLGFRPERAAALRLTPAAGYAGQGGENRYFGEALRLVRAIPGVEAAGLTDALPLGRNRSWNAGAKGRSYSRENPPPDAFVRIVSDGYLDAMHIPLLQGRDFTEHDTDGSKKVIIVNQTMARALWPGEDPIGKTVMYVDPEREVIGVVGDVRHLSLEDGSGLEMYLPSRQTTDHFPLDLVMRTALAPEALASEVRRALAPLDPSVPTNEFRTLQDVVDRASSPRRFVVLLLASFAGFALLLASLGIYAVISYSVSQRQRELGIRMALGASGGELRRQILRETFRLAGLGLAVGLPIAWVLSRSMSSLLYGIDASDPLTFSAMIGTLAAVAALAGYLPALRASRTNPLVALRAD
jgi:predicted permease